MEIIEYIKNGAKKRLIISTFCLGISIDQLTPFYIKLKYTHVISIKQDFSHVNNVYKQKTSSKSMFKNNFGKRKRF